MNPANVQKALDAFLRADYAAAIKIYHELGALLGEQYFKANIEICRARLGLSEVGVVISAIDDKDIDSRKRKKRKKALDR